MKKNVQISLFLFSLLTAHLSGQNWFELQSRWTYSYGNFGTSGYVEMTVEKDTVIEGKECQALKLYYYLYHFYEGNYEREGFKQEYIYEEDSVTYIYIEEKGFDTLFNIQAQVGESWELFSHFPDWPISDALHCEVLAKGTSRINEVELPWIYVEYDFGRDFIYRDTVFQRIGNKHSFFLPWDWMYAQVDGHLGGPLWCYSDSELGLMDQSPLGCEYVRVNTEEPLFDESQIKIFPNPAGEILTIRDERTDRQFHEKEIEIYSIEGKFLQSLKFSNEARISLDKVENGVLILLIKEAGKIIRREKIVKH